ncbi:DUF1835 domain-containing protein [Paenibacillus antri]|uniref:DUF1835 domain-containing protein n=1 Tax=Paenibacillus antri TaxID=2582848 RepID=A0A5R9G491_9BACL|nr:DUF1835 domain-containing protein [Paenibacillus antri]TLS51182.1 DUF1835 domain-containing protein [Paenibacillus antri]
MLHVTNGDAVAAKLKESGLPGDVLPWREMYSEGPIYVDPETPSNRAARAAELERRFGIPPRTYVDSCLAQEAALDRAAQRREEVALWFEHDLFDQAMLCRLLHRLSAAGFAAPGGRTKLSLLCIGAYPGIEPFRGLGQLTAAQLRGLAAERLPVDDAVLRAGAALWEAYASPDPMRLQQALREADGTALPFAQGAFAFHLSRFPSIANGLGRVERVALELVRGGVDAPVALFRAAGDRLIAFGMGDLQFWATLRTLSQGAVPLLRLEGDPPFPRFDEPPAADFLRCRLRLTAAGEDVLNGRADHVALNGVDQWLGGARLDGTSPRWRWDETNVELIQA